MRIALIVPYFGKLPEYFDLWLKSCAANPKIDWLLFTDDKSRFEYPNNIIVKYECFDDFKYRFQSKFDFKISIDRSYKLCDFRPAYGYIFSEELKDYNFWGYCDIDVIFGDLNRFITDDVLLNNDKIFSFGHLTLYKNEKELNLTFMKSKDYKNVFTSSKSYGFDESGSFCDNINLVYKRSNLRTFDKYFIADINFRFKRLRLVRNHIIDVPNYIFEYSNGKVYGIYYLQGKMQKKEFMYIHLQKRYMCKDSLNDKEKYMIISNKFIDYIECIDEEQIKYLSNDKRLSDDYFKYQYQFYKNKLNILLETKNKFKTTFDILKRYYRTIIEIRTK